MSNALHRTDRLILAAVAALLGVLLAQLSLLWAALLLAVAGIAVLTLIDPLYGIGAALLLGPTKPLTDLLLPQLPLDFGQMMLIVALAAWGMYVVRRREPVDLRSPLNVPLLLMLGAAGLSLLNAVAFGAAVTEFIKWAQIVIIVWIVAYEARRDGRLWGLVGVVLTAAAIQALIGLWQFGLRGQGPDAFAILGGRFYRAYGTFEQPNPFAGFIGLLLPIAIGLTAAHITGWRELLKARTVALIALCGLLLAALLASWSRGAWIGFSAAITMMVLVWPRERWLGVGIVLGGLVLGAITLQTGLLPASVTERLTGFIADFTTLDVRGMFVHDANFSVVERIAHWQAAWWMAEAHPLTGVGIGQYEIVYGDYALINWPDALGHAHNYYLNILAETGIIGLVSYMMVVGSGFTTAWYAVRRTSGKRRGVVVGIIGGWTHVAVHNLLDNLYVGNIHLHIAVLLGVLSAIVLQEASNHE